MYYIVKQEVYESSPMKEFQYVIYLMDRATNTILDRLEVHDCPDLAHRACSRLNLSIRADLRQS